MNLPQRLNRLALSCAAIGMLSACSGGGDGAPAPAPPAPPPAVGGITLAGVVARGAALANASVAVTCATGTGTATTAANGSYSVTITGGALPCVLKATSSDSATRLHSVAPAGTSTSVTVNVTPLTELVVAQLTGKDPATYVAAVVPSTLAATVTASAVATAQTALASTLAAGGLNTSTAGDFISGPLVAANGSTAGNAYDVVLDRLSAQLATAGTTLAALTATIAANSPAAPPPAPTPTGADTVSLPADLLLKPKAANCAALASGPYRLIKMAPSPGYTQNGNGAVTAVDTLDFDAPSLSFRKPGTTTVEFTLTANGPCRYSLPNNALDMVVSPAGVLVAQGRIGADDDSVDVSARGTQRMIIGLPVQNVAVAELAGTWNHIEWLYADDPWLVSESQLVTVASSGATTQVKCGGNVATPEASCVADTGPLPVFRANGTAGLDLVSNDPRDPWNVRVFAYRAGSGELMLAYLSDRGELGFLTRQRTLPLPAVGAVTANWSVDVRVNGLASDPLYYRTHTVASVNTAAGTLVRNTAADGSTVTVPQTLEYNKARNGFIHRLASSTTASNGTAATVREGWFLPLTGFGLTVHYLPATVGADATSNAVFGLSVSKQP